MTKRQSDISFDDIRPGPTDRSVIIGMTGSGKTTLVKQILSDRQYVVVHDSKGNIFIPGYARVTTLAECISSRAERIIYAPTHEELDLDLPDTWDIINAFFRWVFMRRNTTLYVDEVYAVVRRQTIPHYYHALLTRGRELNAPVLSSTQRPMDIPQVVLSESEHYYVFKLRMPQDRLKVKQILGLGVEELRVMQKQQFYYANAEGDIMGPLKLELGSKSQPG